MTDPEPEEGWRQTLEKAATVSGHEARNALNGLVVNLEVVRSMAQRAGFDAEPFMGQAVAQAEESVRLTEATIALLKLVLASVSPDGYLTAKAGAANTVSLEAGAASERLCSALQPLSDRGAVSIEQSGSTVILRIPSERHD